MASQDRASLSFAADCQILAVEKKLRHACEVFGRPQAPVTAREELLAQIDECAALIEQIRDAFALSDEQERRVDSLEEELNNAESLAHAGLPKDQLRADDKQLAKLYRDYKLAFAELTQTHSSKSLAQLLSQEFRTDLREQAFAQYVTRARDSNAYPIVLKILARRKVLSLNGVDVGDASELTRKVARAVSAHLSPLLAAQSAASPAEIFHRLSCASTARVDYVGFRTAAFARLQEIFGVSLLASQTDTQHPHNDRFELRGRGGEALGEWEIDAHRRPGKYRGAWTQTVLSRRMLGDASVQRPMVFIGLDVENGTLSARQARSFLHELGHALEHCLSERVGHAVAGTNPLRPEHREIASLYFESLLRDSTLVQLASLPPTFGAHQASLLELARVCVLSELDLRLKRDEFQSAQDLRDTVDAVKHDLNLHHPLIVSDYAPYFDHAFADGNYAGHYHGYLRGFVLAAALKDRQNDPIFENFWRKNEAVKLYELDWRELDLERLTADLC